MCITAPGRVIQVDERGALIDLDGLARRASTLVVPDVVVGDWVIVGAGTILRRIDPAEAIELAEAIAAAAGRTDVRTLEGDPR